MSIADMRAHDLIVRAVDEGVMANSYIPRVLEEWRETGVGSFARRHGLVASGRFYGGIQGSGGPAP